MAGGRDAAWDDVRMAAGDRASGAAEVALRAAEALAALPRGDLPEAARTLVRGHPSMAPLWRLAGAVLDADDHVAVAGAFARRIRDESLAVARVAASLIREPVVLHSYSSTLVAAVAAAGVAAVCASSDPGGEGRETARQLTRSGVDARLVTDREAADYVRRGAAALAGADAVGPGGAVNKVGTRALAEAARAGGGRCLVVAGSSKLVAADVPAPDPFERIPLELLDAVVTENGSMTPAAALEATASFAVHPLLQELLAAD